MFNKQKNSGKSLQRYLSWQVISVHDTAHSHSLVLWHLPSYSALILRVSSGPLWAEVTLNSQGIPKVAHAFFIFSQWPRSEVDPINTTTLPWLFVFRSSYKKEGRRQKEEGEKKKRREKNSQETEDSYQRPHTLFIRRKKPAENTSTLSATHSKFLLTICSASGVTSFRSR